METDEPTAQGGDPVVAAEDVALEFPDGIPGFPEARSFLLQELVEDGAFQLLHSLDVEGLELVVAQPWLFFPDYSPEIGETDQRELGIEQEQDALVFCAVTLPEDDGPPTMNLLGPFIVNRHTNVGRQIVLEDDAAAPVSAPLVLG
jgi:flagellar assembly factor FliW